MLVEISFQASIESMASYSSLSGYCVTEAERESGWMVDEPAATGVEQPAAPGVEQPAATGVEQPAAPGVEAPPATGIEAAAVAAGVEEPKTPGVEEPKTPKIFDARTVELLNSIQSNTEYSSWQGTAIEAGILEKLSITEKRTMNKFIDPRNSSSDSNGR